MKVLYAEDEKPLSNAITEILKIENYQVDPVYDGIEAIKHLKEHSYDAVILDIMMPGMDGIEVLKKIREEGDYTPVILLTAKAETEDRIAGLTVGADDYLSKPFVVGELMARLNAITRRAEQYRLKEQSIGNIILNCETYELKSNTGSLILSRDETLLLSFLIKYNSTPVSHAEILNHVWKDSGDTQTVNLYISYLNDKLNQLHSTIHICKTNDSFCLSSF